MGKRDKKSKAKPNAQKIIAGTGDRQVNSNKAKGDKSPKAKQSAASSRNGYFWPLLVAILSVAAFFVAQHLSSPRTSVMPNFRILVDDRASQSLRATDEDLSCASTEDSATHQSFAAESDTASKHPANESSNVLDAIDSAQEVSKPAQNKDDVPVQNSDTGVGDSLQDKESNAESLETGEKISLEESAKERFDESVEQHDHSDVENKIKEAEQNGTETARYGILSDEEDLDEAEELEYEEQFTSETEDRVAIPKELSLKNEPISSISHLRNTGNLVKDNTIESKSETESSAEDNESNLVNNFSSVDGGSISHEHDNTATEDDPSKIGNGNGGDKPTGSDELAEMSSGHDQTQEVPSSDDDSSLEGKEDNQPGALAEDPDTNLKTGKTDAMGDEDIDDLDLDYSEKEMSRDDLHKADSEERRAADDAVLDEVTEDCKDRRDANDANFDETASRNENDIDAPVVESMNEITGFDKDAELKKENNNINLDDKANKMATEQKSDLLQNQERYSDNVADLGSDTNSDIKQDKIDGHSKDSLKISKKSTLGRRDEYIESNQDDEDEEEEDEDDDEEDDVAKSESNQNDEEEDEEEYDDDEGDDVAKSTVALQDSEGHNRPVDSTMRLNEAKSYHVEKNAVERKETDEGFKQVSNGVKKKIIKKGTGRDIETGDTITIHCIGYIDSNPPKKFWSTKDSAQKPFSFAVGKRQVIKGWDEGARSMRLHERSQIKIDPSKAYGKYGFEAWGIPPNVGIILEMEVIEHKRLKKR